MGIGNLFQRNTSHDDLFAPQTGGAEKRGYLGDTEHIKAGGVNEKASPDYQMDGGGESVVNGWKQGGTSAFDQDVDRYRRMGADSQNRQAVQLNQGASNESRGLQMGALGMMGVAAQGGAPSRAAELGNAGADNAIRSAGASMAGARGPGAAIAAAGQAQGGAGQQMTQLGQQVADQRAQEMARAQAGYAKATQGVEGQDIQAATTQAQLEAQQRALNEARQEGMEGRGWDVRKQQQQAADDYHRQQQAHQAAQDAQDAAQSGADWNRTMGFWKDSASTGASIAAASDERMKTKVVPMGSLAHFMHGGR